MYKWCTREGWGVKKQGQGQRWMWAGAVSCHFLFHNISVEMGGATLKSQSKHVQCGQWKKKLFLALGAGQDQMES